MARHEATLTLRGGVRFMNVALEPLMPGRTLESIKMQRSSAVYKRYLEEFLSALRVGDGNAVTRARAE